MRRFIKDIQNTFYNPVFYESVGQVPFGRTLWLVIRITAVGAVVFVLGLVPYALSFQDRAESVVSGELFPEELEITIENGVASTNLSEEPYFVTGEAFGVESGDEEPQRVLMIDTTRSYAIEDLGNIDVPVLLTRDALIYKEGDQYNVQPLSSIVQEDVVINEALVEPPVRALVENLSLIYAGAALLLIAFLIPAYTLGLLILAFLLSPFTFILQRLKGQRYPYDHVYKATIYALIPASVLSIAYALITLQPTGMPFLAILTVYLIVLVWNTRTVLPEESTA